MGDSPSARIASAGKFRALETFSGLRSSKLFFFLVPTMYVCAALLRVIFYLPSHTTPWAWDGPSYMSIITKPGPLTDLIGAGKPPIVPLIYRLLGANVGLIIAFQMALSILAWSILARRIGASLSPKTLGAFGTIVILAFSTTPFVTYWDPSILSESISISLLALIVAAGLWLVDRWTIVGAALLVLLAFAWAFSRDANAYLLPVLAVVFTGAVIMRRAPRGLLVVAAAFVLIFGGTILDAGKGERWKFPLLDVLSQRILTDPSATQYFAQHGMPISPALMQRAGEYGDGGNFAYFKDPALEGFRNWLDRSGKNTYVSYLVSHPLYTLTAPRADFSIIFSTPDIDNYRPLRMSKQSDSLLTDLIAPVGPLVLALVLASVGSMIGLVLLKRRRASTTSQPLLNSGLRLGLVLLLLALVYGYVSWHGDDMEVERHSVQAAIIFRLGLWFLLLFSLQSIILLRRNKTTAAAA